MVSKELTATTRRATISRSITGTSTQIQIATQSSIPVYQQIVEQVSRSVASGQLPPDVEVVSIRHLANQLGLNRNTVARAYFDLKRAGMFTVRAEGRTKVTHLKRLFPRQQRLSLLAHLADELLRAARNLDLKCDDVVQLLQTREKQTG